MKKILLSLAATLLVAGTTAYADWTSGNTSTLAVAGGEAAIQFNLTTDQKLGINISTKNEGTADAVFSTAASNSTLSLSGLPLQVSQAEGIPNAFVSVTQFVSTDTGKRFYLFETGNVQGLRIVSYAKGNFQVAFDASSIDTASENAHLEIQKKKLLLHVTTADGEKTYTMDFDKATGMFVATPA